MTFDRLEQGQSAETEVEVSQDLTTNRTGRPGDEVLSTPELLRLMERCCIKATDHLLPEGYTTVGYAVDKMRHIAPTKVGSLVTVKAVLEGVDGNRLSYSLEAFEGQKQIGTASHKRAIIPIDPVG